MSDVTEVTAIVMLVALGITVIWAMVKIYEYDRRT